MSTDRQIVNLTLTDGLLADKTRVVFNEKKSVGYEMDCDAAKFMSTERVPQLYTLDQQQARYAINERPSGEVPVGYAATAKGELSISVTRMDQPMLLRDQELGVTHDLSLGAYTFTTEAGNFDRRFTLLANHNATGVGELLQQTGVSLIAEQGGIAIAGSDSHDVAIYSTDGVLLVRQAADGFISLPKGAYVIKVDNRTAKLLVR